MSIILMTGASTYKGGFVALELTKAGHQVFRVGKGGPDLHVDFRGLNTQDVRLAFALCKDRHGGYPQHLILNAYMDCEGEFLDLDVTKDFAPALHCNLTANLYFVTEFLRIIKKTQNKDIARNDVPRILGIGKDHYDLIGGVARAGFSTFLMQLPYFVPQIKYYVHMVVAPQESARELIAERTLAALTREIPESMALPGSTSL